LCDTAFPRVAPEKWQMNI